MLPTFLTDFPITSILLIPSFYPIFENLSTVHAATFPGRPFHTLTILCEIPMHCYRFISPLINSKLCRLILSLSSILGQSCPASILSVPFMILNIPMKSPCNCLFSYVRKIHSLSGILHRSVDVAPESIGLHHH